MSGTHGLNSTYNVYGCRCAECRAGHAAYIKIQRERRSARLADDPTLAPHGSYTTYRNWGCRCRPCTKAHTAQWRKNAAVNAGGRP